MRRLHSAKLCLQKEMVFWLHGDKLTRIATVDRAEPLSLHVLLLLLVYCDILAVIVGFIYYVSKASSLLDTLNKGKSSKGYAM